MRRRVPPINQTIAHVNRNVKENFWGIKIEKKDINQPDFTTPVQSINNSSVEVINRIPIINDIPFYPDPNYRPPPKLVRIPMSESLGNIDISPEINIDFEENSPFQEGVILETFQRPYKSFFQELQELEGLVNTGRLIQKFLPTQADIDKISKIIQKKVLKVHLCLLW